MQVKLEETVTLVKAKKSGNKGWYLGKCLFCGKEDHCGYIFGNISSFTCKKCGETGNIYKALKHIDRLDLLIKNYTAVPQTKLKEFLSEVIEEDLDYTNLPRRQKPLAFKRIYENEYLESRGFTTKQFEINPIGISNLDPKVKKDYIIFLIERGGECVGWLGRSIKEKDEIDEINRQRKENGNKVKYLRWVNSADTAFEKILYGYNEVVKDKTKTVILVEGITSKANIDIKLDLLSNDEIKCCATFGKKVSRYQLKQLEDAGVETIILLYDKDAIKEAKTYSFMLERCFEVLIGYIPFKNSKGKDKDPGDLSHDETYEVFNNLETPIEYYVNKIPQFNFEV